MSRLSIPSKSRYLFAFDFDHTIIHANSDVWIEKAQPEGSGPFPHRQIWQQYEADPDSNWLAHVNRVLVHLAKTGATQDHIRKVMQGMPWTDGMPELLSFLRSHRHRVDCIILSDANTHFIDWITSSKGLGDCFSQVITNRGEINPQGVLQVSPCMAPGEHSCPRCPSNLCKGKALKELLDQAASQGVQYSRVLYAGDGGNDLCPSLTCLGPRDVVFPRVGFKLHKMLGQLQEQQQEQEQGQQQGQQQQGQPGGPAGTGDAGSAADVAGPSANQEMIPAVAAAAVPPPAAYVTAQVVPWSDGDEIRGWIQDHLEL